MKKDLFIIGASGQGKIAADIAIKMGQWNNINFLDDNEKIKKVMGIDVVGKTTDALKHIENADYFVAIGNNEVRKNILISLIDEGAIIATLIHESAVIGSNVKIGKGTIIMAGVVINLDTQIGSGCIINTSSSLDHDNLIEDYVHISPGVHLAGNVKVGRKSWLGIGSTVSNNVTICQNSFIGAGAVVIKDIKEAGTYVGVPVRRIDR